MGQTIISRLALDGTVTEETIEVPDAPAQSWDAYDFKLRFTADERKAIRTASKTSPDVEDFLDLLDTAAATGTRIKSDDVVLNAGLEMMETAGLLGQGRAAEIAGG
jgi:hypothetical protein